MVYVKSWLVALPGVWILWDFYSGNCVNQAQLRAALLLALRQDVVRLTVRRMLRRPSSRCCAI
jgi:hypothetical protein